MKLSSRQTAILLIGAVVAVGIIVLLMYASRAGTKPPTVNLSVWGTESEGTFSNILSAYKNLRPNVTVTYTAIDPASYQSALLNALASGQGPDVFMIGNRDLPKDIGLLLPASSSVASVTQVRGLFPTAVESDFVSGGQVYALPLYLDTLALIYNRDLFDRAAIVNPPATWDDFQADVTKIRSLDQTGNIMTAGAAIGGSARTIPQAADILSLLMLQNGASMTSADDSAATFDSFANPNPGLAAFSYYLQFANAGSPYYTWNDSLPGALDLFAAGKDGMIFGYKSTLDALKSKSPFLNAAVAPVPQVAGNSAAYPSYQGFAVSKQTRWPTWAWDFVTYAATDPGATQAYFAASGRPPALRSLIAQEIGTPDYDVFARQALTARSWHEPDDQKVQAIFSGAVQSVLSGSASPAPALSAAQDAVTGLLRAQLHENY